GGVGGGGGGGWGGGGGGVGGGGGRGGDHARAMAIVEAAAEKDVFLIEAFKHRCPYPQSAKLLKSASRSVARWPMRTEPARPGRESLRCGPSSSAAPPPQDLW